MEWEKKNVCQSCIGDQYLKEEISKLNRVKRCFFCKEVGLCINIGELSKYVDFAVINFYDRTSSEPDGMQLTLMNDRESNYNFQRNGNPIDEVIAELVNVEPEVAIAVRLVLQDKYSIREYDEIGIETEFAEESYYTLKAINDDALKQRWEQIEKSLIEENRYLNSHYLEFFNTLIENEDFSQMIVKTSKRKSIYRARVFDSEKNLTEALQQPDKSLGPPPFHLASSGRMNAQGISAFYGAMNEKTCIAEVRPFVGSITVVAKFTPLESLKLLDLTRELPVPKGSFCDKAYLEKCQLRLFLYRFKERISKPVIPSNTKIDYIITQAFADFLAASNMCLDGIIYPSVQLKGRKSNNIILFHKSAKVKELEYNYSMVVEWWHEDGELYYNLVREDEGRLEKPDELDDIFNYKQLSMNANDLRKDTLQIDLNSIKIMNIEAVLFKSKSNEVSLS